MSDRHFDVLVIGAGLAGAVAARDLALTGRRIIVLEASRRIGGRTYSRPFEGNGPAIDLGGEWVAPVQHDATVAEIRRYGLHLVEPADGPVRWHLCGSLFDQPEPPVDAEQLRRVLRQLEHDASELLAAKTAEAATRFDEPWSDYVARLDLDPMLVDLLHACAYMLMGAAPNEHSALAILTEVAQFGSAESALMGDVQRIAEGADALAKALLAASGVPVHFLKRVTQVAQDQDTVTALTADGKSFSAVAAVVTVPLAVLHRIDFSPAPTEPIQRLIAAGHAGRAFKAWSWVQGATAATFCLGTTDVRISSGRQLSERGELRTTWGLAPWPGSPVAVQQGLQNYFPDVRVDGVDTHDWVSDPDFGATWLAPRPSTHRWLVEAMRPFGRVMLAGSDVARRWSGWMEGALLAGREAAQWATAVNGEHANRKE